MFRLATVIFHRFRHSLPPCARAFFLAAATVCAVSVVHGAANNHTLLPVPTAAYQEAAQQPKNLADPTMTTTLLQLKQDQWQLPASNPLLKNAEEKVQQPLNPGPHFFLLDLHEFHSIDTLGLYSNELSGRALLKVANAALPPNSSRWKRVVDTPVRPNQYNPVDFPLSEARYVLLHLEVRTPGTFERLYLAGNEPVGNFALQLPPYTEWPESSEETPLVELDFAKMASGGRITHVSSGRPELAWHMIDEDPSTYFEFEPDTDGAVFFIATLQDQYPMETLALRTAPFSGKVAAYIFESLPQELTPRSDNEGSIILSNEFFQTYAATSMVQVEQPTDYLQLPLNNTQGRYLLLRIQADPVVNPLTIHQFLVIAHVPAHLARYHPTTSLLIPAAPPAPDVSPEAAPPAEPPRVPPSDPPASL